MDDGAIIDAVFDSFRHPLPSGFDRIMVEKALLWVNSFCYPTPLVPALPTNNNNFILIFVLEKVDKIECTNDNNPFWCDDLWIKKEENTMILNIWSLIFLSKKTSKWKYQIFRSFSNCRKNSSNISELCKIRILNCWLKTRQTEVRSAIFTDFFAFFCVWKNWTKLIFLMTRTLLSWR